MEADSFMMKRILAVALALAVLLPALGAAEAKPMIGDAYENGRQVMTAISVLADESLVGKDVSDLLSELSLVVTAQKEPEQVGLALYDGESEVFCLDLEAAENGVCLRSTMLGEKPVLIGANELESLMARVAAYAVESGLMTQEDADAMLDSMAAALETAPEAEPAPAEEPIELTEEEQQQLIDAFTSIDITPALEEILALAAKVEVIDSGIPQAGSDEAVLLVQGEYTGEDIRLLAQAILKTIESSEGLVALLAEGGFSLTDDSVRGPLDALLEQAADAVKSVNFGVYLGKDGGVVHFSSTPVFELEDNEIVGSISYKRNTLEDSMLYTLDLGAGAQPAQGEYEALFDAELTCETRADGMKLGMKTGELELTASAFKTTQPLEGGEYSEWTLRGEMLLAGESAGTAQLLASSFIGGDEEQPMTSQTLSLSVNDDAPCAMLLVQSSALDEVAPSFAGDAVQPMALSDEEFTAFMDGVLGSMLVWATSLENLVPSAAQ